MSTVKDAIAEVVAHLFIHEIILRYNQAARSFNRLLNQSNLKAVYILKRVLVKRTVILMILKIKRISV